MKPTFVKGATVVCPGESTQVRSLLFAEQIVSLLPSGAVPPADATVIDGTGLTLTPGLVDLHHHGLGKHLYEQSRQDLVTGVQLAPRFGVTTVLPTLYRLLHPDGLSKLQELTQAMQSTRGVHTPGFHLEGPFLKLPGAGALTMNGDVGFLNEMIAACNGKVLAMSISPDVPGIIPVIERLVELSIAPFITHTRASAEETERAIDAGARHATHFYDVFPVPPETDGGVRPVGAVEALLADSRATVDFIADGIHVHPMAIRAALAAKGPRGIIAISDSNIGAGLPEGIYETNWGFPVKVSPNGAARNADPNHPNFGTLAGSSLTLNVAVKNLRQWLKLPDHDIWAMASANPARVVGLSRHGVIQPGAAANLVLWNDDFTPRLTWVNGTIVYDSSTAGPMA
jgi:N-acetylglucosamine-6-phosphate deacetylase